MTDRKLRSGYEHVKRQTRNKRHREVRRQRAPEEDGRRPIAQQAAKGVGRRPEGLVPAHGEQQ